MTGWTKPKDCKILHFEEKRKLLRVEDYKAGLIAVKPFVTAMRAAIGEERRQREQTEGGGDTEVDVSNAHAADGSIEAGEGDDDADAS